MKHLKLIRNKVYSNELLKIRTYFPSATSKKYGVGIKNTK